MIDIILSNFGFWLNFLIPVIIGGYLAFFHKEYAWKEFGIQVGATFAYMCIIYFSVFYTTTDLFDMQYKNSQVKKFEYYESWTERVTYTESYSCGTTKNPRTCTRTKVRYDYHSPYYQIKTNIGETIDISKSAYRTASSKFGDREVMLHRSDQSSIGDGNKYVSIPNAVIPTSVSYEYVNYVKASRLNVIKEHQSKEYIAQLTKDGKLRPYPRLSRDQYGATYLNRVIDTTNTLSKDQLAEVTRYLSLKSSYLGPSKHVNPIIYITDQDRDFKYYLKASWNNAKKNDAILILGMENGKVVWSDAIAWTNNTDFLVDCSNDFKGMTVDNTLVDKFSQLISSEYVRKPMKEFEYLKENITLDWYWQVIIFLINLLISGFLFRLFLTNQIR